MDKGSFPACICLSTRRSGGSGRKPVWLGDGGQEQRAEVGQEAGVSQCMRGALGKVKDSRLYPKRKGTHLKDFRQEWPDQLWWV